MGEAKRVAKHRKDSGYSHKAHAVPFPNKELDPQQHPEFFRNGVLIINKDVQPHEVADLLDTAFDSPRERALREAYSDEREVPDILPITPKVRQEGAGKRGGNCYRTACQKPGATFFNHSTHKWYCADCAHWLNTDVCNKKFAMEYYGGPLCIPEAEYDAMSDEDKRYGKSLKRDRMHQEQKDALTLVEGKSAYPNIGG